MTADLYKNHFIAAVYRLKRQADQAGSHFLMLAVGWSLSHALHQRARACGSSMLTQMSDIGTKSKQDDNGRRFLTSPRVITIVSSLCAEDCKCFT